MATVTADMPMVESAVTRKSTSARSKIIVMNVVTPMSAILTRRAKVVVIEATTEVAVEVMASEAVATAA